MSDITMLQAQLQDAESTIKVWKAQALSSHENLMQSQDQIDAMRIENARLRKALIFVRGCLDENNDDAIDRIDAALRGEE